jgi:hypothetical protein
MDGGAIGEGHAMRFPQPGGEAGDRQARFDPQVVRTPKGGAHVGDHRPVAREIAG